MIKSRADYYFYLEADRLSCRRPKKLSLRQKLENLIFPNLVWEYQQLLRKYEYYINCRKDIVGRIYSYYLELRFQNFGYRLGFTICPNSIGPGLRIAHYPQVLVHADARIGENCNLYQGVTIGKQPMGTKAPRIGNNVYIGAGAKVIGDVDIADGVVIGTNAVVTKSITEPNITVAGVPARKISNRGSQGRIVFATSILRGESLAPALGNPVTATNLT
jgi:serine O-acetyltransferase